MTHKIRLKKGFSINLKGKPESHILTIEQPNTFALKPTDFKGMSRPKELVKEGDNVKVGDPLFFDKAVENVFYTAPVSGEVVQIKRGEKRKLLEIIILADKELDYKMFKKYDEHSINDIPVEEVKNQLMESGLWTAFVQRPYGIVADPNTIPKAIFISGFDTHPLAPDTDFLMKDERKNFNVGLHLIKKFTHIIHLGLDGNKAESTVFSELNHLLATTGYIGPHPAGNVGTHIHHTMPIAKGDIIWTIDPLHVAQIGKLFLKGYYDSSKKIAITGSGVKKPQYVISYPGACLDKLLKDQTEGENLRYISGNVLTGENVGFNGYLGFYHHQITVIPEGNKEEFLGWLLPSLNKLSFHNALGLFRNMKKEYDVTTNTHGEKRGFVVSGNFENVMPMDIYPCHLFKSIIANDFDEMEALGIYELIEEDVALCEFIDVSKNDLQALLREGIDLLRTN